MRRGRVLFSIVLLFPALRADTVTLKDGTTVSGTFLGGNARQIRIALSDHIQTFDIQNVVKIEFGPVNNATAAPAADPEPARQPDPPPVSYPEPAAQTQQGSVFRPDPANNTTPAPSATTELSAGTAVTVRTIDPIDSQVNRVGETFHASVDDPVSVGGQEVIPRGADVVIRLVDDQESGKITGKTVLTLNLASITVNGKPVDVNTQTVTKASSSRGERSGKVIGAGTVLGAIIGAAAGGGKGAAIGAASGAAVGTGAEIATKGQRVHIPPETRLTFTLENAIRL